MRCTAPPPEYLAQTMSTRDITFTRPNPLDRAEPPKRTRGDEDEDSALLSACHTIWRRSLKIERMAKVYSVEQGCLTCRTVRGLDKQHADDNDSDAFKVSQLSSTSFRHVLRTSSRIVSKVAIGTSSVCSFLGSRVRSCRRSKKMVS